MPELLKLLLTSEPNIAVATLIKRCVVGESRCARKNGEVRDQVKEMANIIKKHGVKKGRRIIMSLDSSADHPTFTQET
jgi:hypothetical protein